MNKLETVIVFHKTTKNFHVYGPDPMDAQCPVINPVYVDKTKLPSEAPRALRMTLEEVK